MHAILNRLAHVAAAAVVSMMPLAASMADTLTGQQTVVATPYN